MNFSPKYMGSVLCFLGHPVELLVLDRNKSNNLTVWKMISGFFKYVSAKCV